MFGTRDHTRILMSAAKRAALSGWGSESESPLAFSCCLGPQKANKPHSAPTADAPVQAEKEIQAKKGSLGGRKPGEEPMPRHVPSMRTLRICVPATNASGLDGRNNEHPRAPRHCSSPACDPCGVSTFGAGQILPAWVTTWLAGDPSVEGSTCRKPGKRRKRHERTASPRLSAGCVPGENRSPFLLFKIRSSVSSRRIITSQAGRANREWT